MEPDQASLGLFLSAEKTKVTWFHEGFSFRGFDIKSRFVRMRAKSVENFKTKVRRITRRSHNLDAEMTAAARFTPVERWCCPCPGGLILASATRES